MVDEYYDKLTGDYDAIWEFVVLSVAGYIIVRFFYKLINADKWIDHYADLVRQWILSMAGGQ